MLRQPIWTGEQARSGRSAYVQRDQLENQTSSPVNCFFDQPTSRVLDQGSAAIRGAQFLALHLRWDLPALLGATRLGTDEDTCWTQSDAAPWCPTTEHRVGLRDHCECWSRDEAHAECNVSAVLLQHLTYSDAPIKRTAVERQVNRQILYLFILLLILSLVSTIGSSIRKVSLGIEICLQWS
jgi:hypothetical protein